jgi:hypothetical protein
LNESGAFGQAHHPEPKGHHSDQGKSDFHHCRFCGIQRPLIQGIKPAGERGTNYTG